MVCVGGAASAVLGGLGAVARVLCEYSRECRMKRESGGESGGGRGGGGVGGGVRCATGG